MSAKVLTADAAREAKITLIEGGRGTQAVHDAVIAMRAARRSGSANTKTKAEVALSGAKPWRQKGTGRARAGYKSSPIWRGGGVVFGPKPRDYSKKVPKTVRRLAFQKALTERINAGDVLTIDTFAVKESKTKSFLNLLKEQTDAKKVLLISDSFDENTYRAARNVKPVLLATANDVNTEQLLAFDKILVTGKALETLGERTTSSSSGASRPPLSEGKDAASGGRGSSKRSARSPLPQGEGRVSGSARTKSKASDQGARE